MRLDLTKYIEKQQKWSATTFGPGSRRKGIIDHIKKELKEVEEAKFDELEEWIDIVILALDGAWRAGYDSWQIINKLEFKQEKNFARKWPDWRTAPDGKAIEHIREEDS